MPMFTRRLPVPSIPLRIQPAGFALIALLSTCTAVAEDGLLERSRALYAGLQTYADSGSVLREYGQSSSDLHRFTTHFRRTPRGFVFDFTKQSRERYVVWGDPDAFHTWLSSTGQRFDYPNPRNATAISGSGVNTSDAVLKIPPLLYSKAALGGFFDSLGAVVTEGSEKVDGHPCVRLASTASTAYEATGKLANQRKVTVWIDSESLLIRQIREEWPPLPGQRSRVTTTIEPEANPKLDDNPLKFVVPGSK